MTADHVDLSTGLFPSPLVLLLLRLLCRLLPIYTSLRELHDVPGSAGLKELPFFRHSLLFWGWSCFEDLDVQVWGKGFKPCEAAQYKPSGEAVR